MRVGVRRFLWPSLLLGAAAALLNTSVVAAQGTVTAQECCVALLNPVGARAISLGQALTARPSADALLFNPAGVQRGDTDEFIIHHATTFEGQTNVFSLLINSTLIGTFGLSYMLVDQGEEVARDSSGADVGTLSLRQHELLATFATSISRNMRAGVNYKLYYFGNTCSGRCSSHGSSGTTHMIDMGLQYSAEKLNGLELGVAVNHIGFPLQVVNAEQADATPARLRAGAAYDIAQHIRHTIPMAIWVSADALMRARSPRSATFAIGVETSFDNTIYVRAGHSGSGDGLTRGGTGLGIGLRYQRYSIGIAKGFGQSLLAPEGEPFQVSFGIGF